MAPTKKLSTQVQNEKKFIAMTPGRISLRPKGSRTVQLNDGTFDTIDTPALDYECEGDRRMGSIGRALDPNVPRDKEILEAVEQLLIEKPWMATDIRYRIEIIGEHQAQRPWSGWDDQTADQARLTYEALPVEARPSLETMMKYELDRTRWDEDLEEEVSITDEDKVKMINELHKAEEKAARALSNDAVDLA